MFVKYYIVLQRTHNGLLDFIIMFHTFPLIPQSSMALSISSQFKATKKCYYTDIKLIHYFSFLGIFTKNI